MKFEAACTGVSDVAPNPDRLMARITSCPVPPALTKAPFTKSFPRDESTASLARGKTMVAGSFGSSNMCARPPLSLHTAPLTGLEIVFRVCTTYREPLESTARLEGKHKSADNAGTLADTN